MLKFIRIIFDSLLNLAVALIMGFGLSEGLLNSFIPHSFAQPGALLATLGFFFMVRWLRTGPDSQEELPHNADFAASPRTAIPAGFTFREASSSQENGEPTLRGPISKEACCGSQGCA